MNIKSNEVCLIRFSSNLFEKTDLTHFSSKIKMKVYVLANHGIIAILAVSEKVRNMLIRLNTGAAQGKENAVLSTNSRQIIL